MATISIPKREYEDLKAAKRKLSVLLRMPFFPAERDKSTMLGNAFGIFKKEFGKKNSVSYINKMRKAWRT